MSQKMRKLGRTSDQRKAMLRAMVTYLLEDVYKRQSLNIPYSLSMRFKIWSQ